MRKEYMSKTGKVSGNKVDRKLSNPEKVRTKVLSPSPSPDGGGGYSSLHRTSSQPKLDKSPEREPVEFREGQSVDLLIGDQIEIGYRAIIESTREGLLYRNEVFQTLRKGQHITGFIKKVREDGKIDLCLQKPGPEKVGDVSGMIIDKLNAQGGFIAVDDKSPPEVIYRLFGVSKKTYKKAIGALYKKRLITLESAGIRLARENGSKAR